MGDRIAGAGDGSVMLTSFVAFMPVAVLGAANIRLATIRPIAAHRSRDHQGQQQKCEDLPEAFHWRRGGKTRRQHEMVKVGLYSERRRLQGRHKIEVGDEVHYEGQQVALLPAKAIIKTQTEEIMMQG